MATLRLPPLPGMVQVHLQKIGLWHTMHVGERVEVVREVWGWVAEERVEAGWGEVARVGAGVRAKVVWGRAAEAMAALVCNV